MNKTVFSIGRDPSSDIVLYDPTNVVSREHATLRRKGGNYFLIDHSTNGTYRNGIRLSSGVEYQVSKADSIVFGNVTALDWNMVPGGGTKMPLPLVLLICLVALAALLVGLYFAFPDIVKPKSPISAGAPFAQIQQDTTATQTKAPKDTLIKLEKVKKNTPKKKVTPKVEKKDFRNFEDEDDKVLNAPSKQPEPPKQSEPPKQPEPPVPDSSLAPL